VGPFKVLLRGVEKATGVQQAPVAGYVARLRRGCPAATPADIVALLEKQYLTAVTSTGAVVGSAAAAPVIGTGLALVVSGVEAIVFVQATALFALAVAQVHGVRLEEVELRRTLVLAVVVGDHGALLVEKMCGHAGEHWAKLLPDMIPMSSITTVNKTLGRWFVTKYGGQRGLVALGKVAPFGLGAAVGAGGNRAIGQMVVNTSRRVFGPPPARFADVGPTTIVNSAGEFFYGSRKITRPNGAGGC
jgi:hypothetical protein